MVMQGGKYDRLSDLNCFWAANDPKYPDDLFARSQWRDGIFKNYNTLNLFYVGYGGMIIQRPVSVDTKENIMEWQMTR